jgi:hypothetical protein
MPKKFASKEEKNAYERERYAASQGAYKERSVARQKENRKVLRQFVWDFLKEHPCIDCGETDPIVLEFDHLSDKKWSIADVASHNVSQKKLNEEIAKCEVRCANCHRKKTAIQLNWYKDIIK